MVEQSNQEKVSNKLLQTYFSNSVAKSVLHQLRPFKLNNCGNI